MNLKYKVKSHLKGGSRIPTTKEKQVCISPPQVPSIKNFGSAGHGNMSNFKSSKKKITTIDLAGV